MSDNEIRLDPRIKILPVADGEVHVVFEWTQEDLEKLARAWLAMQDLPWQPGSVCAAMRLKTPESVDKMIELLTDAKKDAWKLRVK